MENSIYIAAQKAAVLERRMAVVANNIANINTPGFKRQEMIFSEFLHKVQPKHQVSFSQDVSTWTDFQGGPIEATGNTFDLAILGKGFFRVSVGEEPFYTRHGSFRMDETGTLMTPHGGFLMDRDGLPVTLPLNTRDTRITAEGVVVADGLEIAQLDLIEFANPQELKIGGSNLFYAPPGVVPLLSRDARIVQGSIETSNVKGVVEMTRMIEASRSYGAAHRLITEEYTRQKTAIETLGSAVR